MREKGLVCSYYIKKELVSLLERKGCVPETKFWKFRNMTSFISLIFSFYLLRDSQSIRFKPGLDLTHELKDELMRQVFKFDFKMWVSDDFEKYHWHFSESQSESSLFLYSDIEVSTIL
ncbi:hypothetical protein PHYBLDRAFT_171611 [Phycomyces blakesleeanus NRRL 1555(-)]|uniref:Uncharacterized protein n=1 Tax=Phycomyces blakesleeanus (strain ATCC 8743b / DSM 1359 / FGSC 10004 / NBRC 33097 / NRRL 1555) TaxID=763407 RepID=A0A167LDS7_PHYB8|nr:hypothetical protein PHYBLDRAFT_171611 [Phycomyces blakesleeanus NRRL 1555(-)]OAD70228.1 hypothetical protein PHYBLDRAFT_171611 [Phycomyces blakesleeanus NRRL 1555(-)]|eukprot:XP_018288268.1 hypothetical protein PHYBLDRAFT_171611 [Phycomyces blakesleeanus NRRL 1555(-)]